MSQDTKQLQMMQKNLTAEIAAEIQQAYLAYSVEEVDGKESNIYRAVTKYLGELGNIAKVSSADFFEQNDFSTFTDEERNIVGQHIKNLSTLSSFSNDIASEYLDVAVQMVENLIDHLRSQGLSDNGIVKSFKSARIVEVLTMHPTYVGTLNYAISMANACEHLMDHYVNQKQTETTQENSNHTSFGQKTKAALKDLHLNNNPAVISDNLTVEQEVDFAVWGGKQSIKSLFKQYDIIETAFRRKNVQYMEKDLHIGTNVKDWAGFDKDGNKEITAQTTEYAILEGRKAIIAEYKSYIGTLEGRHDQVDIFLTALKKSVTNFEATIHSSDYKNNILYNKDTNKAFIKSAKKEFLRHLYGAITVAEAVDDVLYHDLIALQRVVYEKEYHLLQGEYREDKVVNRELLDPLIDKNLIVRILKEKAPSFLRSEAIKDEIQNKPYSKLSRDVRDVIASTMGQVNFKQQFGFDLGKAIHGKIYDIESDANRLADAQKPGFDTVDKRFYHTIQRLKLAAANQDVISAQIGAEIGTKEKDGSRASARLDMQEFKLLINAMEAEDLRFIMLVESEEGFDNLKEDLLEAFNNPDFYEQFKQSNLNRVRKTNKPLYTLLKDTAFYEIGSDSMSILDAIQQLNPKKPNFKTMLSAIDSAIVSHSLNDNNMTRACNLKDVFHMQIMAAQSDYTRRATFYSKDKVISQEKEIRNVMYEEFGIQVYRYRGGSKYVDPLRAGTDHLKQIADTHNPASALQKDTFQGGDFIDILKHPFTHASNVIMQLETTVFYMTPNSKFYDEKKSSKAQEYTKNVTTLKQEQELRRYFYEDSDALKMLSDASTAEYQKMVFNNHSMFSYVIAQPAGLKYHADVEVGNGGSRAKSKGSDHDPLFLNIVSGTRTIGLSEANGGMLHGFRTQGVLGVKEALPDYVKKIETNIRTLASEKHPHAIFNDVYCDVVKANTSSKMLHNIYKNSPRLSKNINAYAEDVAMTDFNFIWKNAITNDAFKYGKDYCYEEKITNRPNAKEVIEIANQFKEDYLTAVTQAKTEYENPNDILHSVCDDMKDKQPMRGMLAYLEHSHREAALFVLEAKTGHNQEHMQETPTDALRQQVFEHLSEVQQTSIKSKTLTARCAQEILTGEDRLSRKMKHHVGDEMHASSVPQNAAQALERQRRFMPNKNLDLAV